MRLATVKPYPAPITTIFNGRATKILGTISISGDVKRLQKEKKKRKKKKVFKAEKTGEIGHIW